VTAQTDAQSAELAQPEGIQLALPFFEGPLDLLLHLIEREELDITSIALVAVADQYMQILHQSEHINLDALADFISIGARLLLLKSRALLLTDVPDPEVEEVASDLAERLATYRVFRAAAEALRDLEQRGERMYPTSREPLLSLAPAPLAPIGPDDLLAVWRRFLAGPRQGQLELPDVARASVDERRIRILDALRAESRVSFRAMAGETVDQVVATFLAVLELFRRGQIAVEQPSQFADLILSLV
jgi:segregation and condensation protein A